MRYTLGFMCVLAFAIVPVGCGDDGSRCETSADCDGVCGRCVVTCSSVHRDDAPRTWLLAVMGLLGILLAARRKAKRAYAVDREPRPTRRRR